jgi:signal transduction histidine kinase
MIQYECRVKSKEGEWKWLLVREVIFKTNEAGKPVQILGAALDISQRKNMERSLLQNSFQLQQSNTSLEEFAYVASHDLKEPLRKISTFGDRVMNTQSGFMTDEGKVYMSKIVDASQRMQVMINDLLSISMISGDRNFQPYSLQLILEDTKQTLEYKIEQKNALIEADPLPVANIIPSQFRQLFQNLLSNSLKFIPEDRQPIIKIKSQVLLPEDVGVQGLAKATSYLKLEFADNGIGFEEEYAGRIFQIFQRLHGRSEYEGTGIGLAICKKIVEHHGGIIYANGTINVGAVFTIIIPL